MKTVSRLHHLTNDQLAARLTTNLLEWQEACDAETDITLSEAERERWHKRERNLRRQRDRLNAEQARRQDKAEGTR